MEKSWVGVSDAHTQLVEKIETILTRIGERAVDGTLHLEIDEGGDAPVPWAAIDSLSEARPDQAVYVLDPIVGDTTTLR